MRIAKPVYRNVNAVKQRPVKQQSGKKERKDRDAGQQSVGQSSTDSAATEAVFDNSRREREGYGQQSLASSRDLQSLQSTIQTGGQSGVQPAAQAAVDSSQKDAASAGADDLTGVTHNSATPGALTPKAASGNVVDSVAAPSPEKEVSGAGGQRPASWVRIPFPLAPWIPTANAPIDNQVPDSDGTVNDEANSSNGSEFIASATPQFGRGVSGWFSLNASRMREQTVESLEEGYDASWKKSRITRPEFPDVTGTEE